MQSKKSDKLCNDAILQLASGNKEALSIIYDSMARMIFSLAFTITENYSDAEDILQDTMIQIVKYAHTYQNGSNPRAWILAMTRHLAIDTIRKRKSSTSFEENIINMSPKLHADDFQLEVMEMLSVLNETEQQLLLLHLYAGLSHLEISKIMNLSIFAVQKRYQRAIKKLKTFYHNI